MRPDWADPVHDETALERIKRRNRGLESGIPRDYLEGLNRRYLSWYDAYDLSPKIFVNTEEFHVDIPEQLEPVIQRILDAIGTDYREKQPGPLLGHR